MGADSRLGSVYRMTLFEQLGLNQAKGVVLDAGCFDGLFLSTLAAPQRVGIDIQPARPLPGVLVAQADACQPPFAPQSFDTIYALDVIEHIEDDDAFGAALLKLLKPGGKLILTTPNIKIRIFPGFLTAWVSLKWGHHLRWGYDVQRLEQIFSKAGYDCKITELSGRAYRTWYLAARALQFIAPHMAEKWVRRMAKWDASHLVGPAGFMLVQVVRNLG